MSLCQLLYEVGFESETFDVLRPTCSNVSSCQKALCRFFGGGLRFCFQLISHGVQKLKARRLQPFDFHCLPAACCHGYLVSVAGRCSSSLMYDTPLLTKHQHICVTSDAFPLQTVTSRATSGRQEAGNDTFESLHVHFQFCERLVGYRREMTIKNRCPWLNKYAFRH